jgi:NitT/TauT family transport system substrate-binding protein
MGLSRRVLLRGVVAAAGAGALCAPAIAQVRTRIRIGYLHTLAVDAQMWLSDHLGAYEANGLKPDFIMFQTGLELFQAMIGGSLDVLATGAVISNFPARGQGKMFLANAIEFATAQLWVRDNQGIKTIADLRGKRIATTVGTTAHVFLNTALKANNVSAKDVEILNQRMPDAVTSFISGAVPAVALWVPFNMTIRDKVPDARMLIDASAYYPQAAIVGGWATMADFHAKHRDVLVRIVKAWRAGNELLVSSPDQALDILQNEHYAQIPLSELKDQYKAEKTFPAGDWRKLYADGTLTTWLQQVTDFFSATGNIPNPVPASQYFDASIYLDTIGA